MTKKPLFIIGTRPEIIKISTLANELNADVLFTNQHFDKEMSLLFFKLIQDTQLHILDGKNYKSNNIGNFIKDISIMIQKINPSSVIVQGDTNTTLYGALAAKSLGLEINYIESGMRSGDISQIEEYNRTIVSALSSRNFCNHKNNSELLKREGVDPSKIIITGSTVFSVLNSNNLLERDSQKKFQPYILLTLHRPENVDSKDELIKMLSSINSLNESVKFIIHPRILNSVSKEQLTNFSNIIIEDPKDYFEFIEEIKNSQFIISDSGGLQEECAILGKPLLIPRKFTERPEMLGIFNLLVKDTQSLVLESKKLLEGTSEIQNINSENLIYGGSEVINFIADEII